MGLSNFGKDTVAKTIGGDTVGITGTASATTTTSLTGTGFTASVAGPPDTGGHVGHIVVAGSASPFVYGVILSNSTTVLTIDQWHSMTAPETVGSTPGATTPFCIIPGGAPAFYMGISVATRVFTASDNFLTNDGTTISELWFSGGGLRRRLASWAHTTGTATYTLANTFTANGSDTLPQTIAKIGIFQHFVNTTVTTANTGGVLFQTLLTSTATLSASGDNVAITDTVTIS
jgi:hypothetical protein